MAKDHFEKHYYQKDRVDWNFNLTLEDQPAVVAMVKEYAKALNHSGLYSPIPVEWLHSTVLRVGLTNDYTQDEMFAVAEKLEERLSGISLPEFNFDSWWLWGGNVVLHISPDDQFGKLYDAVVAALESVVGKDRVIKTPHGSFIAHMTLAYTKTHDKENEIHQLITDNPVAPASFRATHLALIKQWPTDGHYEWEIVKDIPIGG